MRSSSRLEFVVGVLFAIIAVIGSVFFGWDFGGTSQPLPFALGVLAAIIAVLFTIRNR
jgi:cobalamin biosynthesis protein CobD/CbiB